MTSLRSYAVFRGADGKAEQSETATPSLGSLEVLVKITHSGLCATDMAYMPAGIALGHEGIGKIIAIGKDVTQLKIGDRVGGGYHRNSCGYCKYCLSGKDIYCYERIIFGSSDENNGTLAEYYIGVETYVHKIPDGLDSADAAPLQCAGATVYDALADLVKPASRIGILGMGGLGHLAIQYADKLGGIVVVFSTSASKEAEARGFGASEFHLLQDLGKVHEPVDVLVITGGQPDYSTFMKKEILSRTGIIIPLAVPPENLAFSGLSMFWGSYTITNSLVASRRRHEEMLEFSAVHGIKPQIEKFPLTEAGLNEAINKLKSNKMRYRGVLVAGDA